MEKKLNLYFRGYVPQDIIDDINNDLGKLLNEISVSMTIKEDGNGEKSIEFKYDTEQGRKDWGRRAGAKPKDLNNITAQEVRDRMASGETAEQIAKSLGITRSTLFRRLKKVKTFQTLSEEANVKTDGKL